VSARRAGRSKARPAWERSYRGHVYWLGKQKLGKVSLVGSGHYEWEAAGRTGRSDNLDKARAAVELAVAVSDKQLTLFE